MFSSELSNGSDFVNNITPEYQYSYYDDDSLEGVTNRLLTTLAEVGFTVVNALAHGANLLVEGASALNANGQRLGSMITNIRQTLNESGNASNGNFSRDNALMVI